MKRRILVILGLSFVLFQKVKAQNAIPILKGKVNISIKKGTFECDFILSNIPRIDDYVIRINSGMNIRNIRNVETNNLIDLKKSFTDTLTYCESNAYFFLADTGVGKTLPKAIQFQYVGMFPVFGDTTIEYRVTDWKGNIAFNGYSVRADGSQSAWYPVLYDIKKDFIYDKLKYDIEINCKDCNTIYVNGNIPVKGSKANLKSDIPVELTIFSGKYKVSNIEGTYLLNPDITKNQIQEFGTMVNFFKKYYEESFGIPYKQQIRFIQTTPTSKEDSWLFVSYPTILNIGHSKNGMKAFFDKDIGSRYKKIIAHELAHYYFGNVKEFNSEISDILNEGFAEYLSLKAAKFVLSDTIYNKDIKNKLRITKDFSPIPFAKIKSKVDYKNRWHYIYNYAPLIFIAIEKEIGEQKMWDWMKAILKSKTDFTDYQFLEKTLNSVLQDNTKLELIKEKYFNSDKSMENIRLAI